MVGKIESKLTPWYESPRGFWNQRIRETEAKLARQRELASRATKPGTKQFWEKAAERTEKRVARMRKLAEKAEPHKGLPPTEIAARWAKAMSE
jgi:hypothetical protein